MLWKFLKVDDDINQKIVITCIILRTVLLSFISPTLNQAMYMQLPTKWFAISSVISSVSGLIIGCTWRGKWKKSIIDKFMVFAIIESVAGCFLGFYMALVNQNMWIYAVTTLIYQNIVSVLVGRCIVHFESVLWNSEKRENYDNNSFIALTFSMIIGFLIATIYTPGVQFSFILFGVSCLLDDGGWIIVASKFKKKT